MRLMLVEDEEMLGRFTAQSLIKSGFAVDWVKNGADAQASVRVHNYDMILLDLGLPGMSGEALIRQLRAARTTTPIIILTARGQIGDRIAMLDLGADDYLVKPVDMAELRARIRALKRRTAAVMDYNDVQRIGPLELHQSSRSARWNGQPVTLTPKEFDVLEALMLRRPRIVTRAQIEDALYGWGDEVKSNSIEVYIHFLRRKLSAKLIVTVRGKGYQIGSEESLLAEVNAVKDGAP